jgi:hypothetical protein
MKLFCWVFTNDDVSVWLELPLDDADDVAAFHVLQVVVHHQLHFPASVFCKKGSYTDKKEKKIFLINKEIQLVSFACMKKGFLIYEEIRKYVLHEEAVSHI